ncbi:GAD-like domain-containing protein [Bifidobacterium tissieri]|uniref:GAD-like domain-containing protein n=1 Tax=Bifidobacterium tissieri TaxID=1630162 RepID=A0A261FH11_9BIFI|nr:GAD-like domain-containing protein [Bifidobacterium tissieri]OZG58461.1 GAD-like domain-containing protein [Bifidobacterium tissieri]
MVDPNDRSCFNDFAPSAPMPASAFDRWRDLPVQIIDVWRRWGLGVFCNGYLRTIDPGEWMALTNLLYQPFWLKQSVTPILATAFGDLIVWNGQMRCVETLQFRNSMTRSSMIEYYFANIPDEHFQRQVLGMRGYKTVRRRLPIPQYGECYAYSPLICQGGPERAGNLHIAGMRDYLESIRATGYRLDENTMRFPS